MCVCFKFVCVNTYTTADDECECIEDRSRTKETENISQMTQDTDRQTDRHTHTHTHTHTRWRELKRVVGEEM
jgi:hypothetical protein